MKSRNWFLARFPLSIAALFSRRTAAAGRRRVRPTLASFDKLEERLAFSVGYATVNDWGSGLQGQLTLTNDTSATMTDWQLAFNYNRSITTIWNAQIVSHTGSQYVIKGFDWGRTLAAGATQGVGFTADTGTDTPSGFVLSGLNTPTSTPNPMPTPITPTPITPNPITPTPITPTPIDSATGRVFLVNPAADDIVGFDPSRDRLDFGDVSVHNMIIAKTETGEVAIVNPWASTPEFQVLRGISYRDITMANFGVVQNEHLRQDIGGVVSWEQGIGPRDGSTVYVRSHEYGVQQRIDGFNPATMKLSFLYFGTRERLSLTDTAAGLSISVLPTNQTILLVGVTKAQLMPVNIQFHNDQIVEDQLEVPFGHPAEHFTLVSRTSLLTPTAPVGQATDGYQTSIGQTVPGGHDHGTMPTPITPNPVTTPITPTNGDLWKEQFFAPYVDMGQYPVPDLDGLAKKYGVGLLTLGFMQASPSGKLAWAGYDVLTLDSSNEQAVAIRNEINALRLVGGDVMVSLGGAAGQSLAQSYAQRGLGAPALAMAYAEMVDILKLNKVDFDIEGVAVAQPQILKLQMDAIAIVQMSRPSLGVWLTLPVLPQGLTQDGVNAVRIALTSGVKVDGVNVMAMDYGDSAAPPALKSMGEYAIDAANATFAQMTTLFTSQGQTFGWNQLGVTPMLGVNDVTSEVFTLQDADRLETFARAKGLGMLSMWSINRDNPGPAGQLSNFHTGIPSMSAGGFSLAWGDYGSDPVIVGAVTPVTPTPTPPPTPTLPTLSISSRQAKEGNTGTGLRQFMVTLSAASMQTVTVQYATADGTAKAGSDYTSASGSLTFAPGELTKTISVAVIGDTTVESNEKFVVKLGTAVGATILTGTGTGTIVNDDVATAGGVALTYTQTSSWATGFNGDMKIKNTGTTAINGWTMEFDMNANIVNIWNAVIVSHVGTRYVIKNADWNGTIAAGAEVSFGFQADGVVGELPLKRKFNGVAV